MNLQKILTSNNTLRILVLMIFYITARIVHSTFASYQMEVLSAFVILLFFWWIITFEYLSLFKRDLPKKEYFINIFFIIFFTILLFASIYSDTISGKNYFIQNGIPSDLSFFDALYFSTTTLTTVWYGDIVPVWIFRAFVMIEILMGLIYTWTLVYIVTKHLDDEK